MFRARTIVFASVAGVCAITALSLLYLRSHHPPGCTDAGTIVRVRQEISRRTGLYRTPELVRIVTVAGSWFSIRYVCQAEFSKPDWLAMPDGVLVSSVHYSSELTEGNNQRVSVSVVPILQWQEIK